MESRPASVTATLFLIGLTAVLWLLFAVATAAGIFSADAIPAEFRWIFAAIALAVAAYLAALLYFLRRRSRFAFYFGIATFAGIIAVSVMDQIGLSDLGPIAIGVIILGLLVKDRSWYLQGPQAV